MRYVRAKSTSRQNVCNERANTPCSYIERLTKNKSSFAGKKVRQQRKKSRKKTGGILVADQFSRCEISSRLYDVLVLYTFKNLFTLFLKAHQQKSM